MKKIIFFIGSMDTFGGEQRVVSIIANEFARDNDVVIYTEGGLDCPYRLNNNVNLKRYPKDRKIIWKNPFYLLIRCMELLTNQRVYDVFPALRNHVMFGNNIVKNMYNVIEKEKADFVIAVSGYYSIILGYVKQRGLDAVTIGWEHNSFEAYFRTPNFYYWKQDEIFADSVKYLDYCVVLNEDYAKKYSDNFGIKCEVIYNPRTFVSCEKSSLTNKQFVLCARFVRAKGIDLVIESFNIFSKYNKEWILYIAGDGELSSELEELVQKYSLQDRIIFLGKIDDVKKLLLESSVYLLPSRWEGFPMSLTEACEIGLPFICYDIPATDPFLKSKGGICVNAYDVNAFAQAMLQLAENYELRVDMQKRVLSFAKSISIENIISQWYQLLGNKK